MQRGRGPGKTTEGAELNVGKTDAWEADGGTVTKPVVWGEPIFGTGV